MLIEIPNHYLLLMTVIGVRSEFTGIQKTISKSTKFLKHLWKTLREIRKTKKKKKRRR